MEMQGGDTQEQRASFPQDRFWNCEELLDSVVTWASACKLVTDHQTCGWHFQGEQTPSGLEGPHSDWKR